jgi:voltage-gated potassium channel
MRTRRPSIVRREIDRFLANPASLRNASVVIITITIAAVTIGSVVIWVFDRRDFPDLGTAFWFTLQTITTVGYGDVTPTSPLGRFVAGVVMVVAIGFLTIVTALITSTFIDAAQRRRSADEGAAQRDASEHVEARFQEVTSRLAAIEASLARLESSRAGATGAPASSPGSDDDDPR